MEWKKRQLRHKKESVVTQRDRHLSVLTRRASLFRSGHQRSPCGDMLHFSLNFALQGCSAHTAAELPPFH